MNKKLIIFIVAVVILLLTYFKIYVFSQNLWVPLWYDPWIYRGIALAYEVLVQKWWILGVWWHLWDLPLWIRHEPLRWWLTVALSRVWISIDTQLWIGFIVISILVAVIQLVRKKPWYENMLILLLVALSVIQYEAFSMMYYKQMIWIVVMTCVFALVERKKWFATLSLFIILVTLHRHTSLYTYGTLGVYIIIQAISSLVKKDMDTKLPLTLLWKIYSYIKHIYSQLPKSLIISMIVGMIIGFSLYWWLFNRIVIGFVEPLVTTAWWEGIKWSFMTAGFFFQYNAVLIILAVLWTYYSVKKQWITIDSAWFIFGCVRTISGLLNYRRWLIFFDIFVIYQAVYFLTTLRPQRKKLYYWLTGFVVFVQWSFALWYMSENHYPLISPLLLQDIKNIQHYTHNTDVIMVTNSELAPWVLWYSNRQRLSPWLSDLNKRNQQQRSIWRSSSRSQKCDLLVNSYAKDHGIYIWQVKTQQDYIGSGECFTIIKDFGESVLVKYE